jgi:Ca2+/Na+ antiporter
MNTAKILIVIGIGFIVAGVIAFLLQKFNIPLGRLPGDILIKKENSSFYFPITTCILVSLLLTLIFRLFGK